MASKKRREMEDKDALLCIFRLLTPRDLARCAAVCSSWYKVIQAFPDVMDGLLHKQAEEVGYRYRLSKQEKEFDVKTQALAMEQYIRLAHGGSTTSLSWQVHSSRVNCCQWVMGTLATGSSDNTVKVWNMDSMRCLEEYRVPKKMDIIGVEFDGGRMMAGAGTDVYIWRRGNTQVLRKLGGHGQRLHSMHYMDPDTAVGCGDGTIRIFDLYTGRCSLFLRHHRGPVTCIGLSVALQVLASGSHDCTVQICDPSSGEKILSYFPSFTSGISCLKMLHDGTKLVAGTVSGNLDCWDLRAGRTRPLWTARAGTSGLNTIHSQEYGPSLVLTGGNDGKVQMIRSYTGEIIRVMECFTSEGHRSPVLSAKVGITSFITCHADGTVAQHRCDLNS